MQQYRSFQGNFDKLINTATEIIASDATGLWQVVDIETALPKIAEAHKKHMRELSSFVHGKKLLEVRETLAFVGDSTFKLLHSEGRLKARENDVKEKLAALMETPEFDAWRSHGTPLRERWLVSQ